MSDIKDCETKLLRAETLTEKLGGERDRWDKIAIQMGGEIQNIFCDVLLSAGTISYLGAFESSYRQDIISNSWIPFVKATNIPCASDFSLRNVLGDSLTIQKWIIQGLPDDSTSIENAIMIERSDKWPLIIDPQKQANKWIRKSNSGKNVAFTKPANEDFVAILENAIFTGAVLLLENVGETLDPVLDPLLDKQIETKAGVSTIKIGDTYKQYDRDFRLYMTSNLPNPQFSPEISTKVTILNFTITKQGLREQLRTLICEQECPKETQEKQRVTISASENRKILMEQEEKILALLQSTQGNLLDDEVVINSLTECKTISEDVEKKLKSAKIAEKRIEEIQIPERFYFNDPRLSMLRIRHVVTFAYRRWKIDEIIVQNLYIFRSRAWKWSLLHHVSCLRCLPPPGAGAFSSDRGKSSEAAADPQRAGDSLINIVTQCQHISCSMFCDIIVTS